MMIQKFGNMFDSNANVFVNTVNCVGTMGAGIAKEFRERFPRYYADYVKKCQKGLIKTGKIDLVEVSTPRHMLIVSFPTKNDWRKPSRIEYINFGLEDFKRTILENYNYWKVLKVIAMPCLGCGLGGLDGTVVRESIQFFLGDLDLIFEVWEKSIGQKQFQNSQS